MPDYTLPVIYPVVYRPSPGPHWSGAWNRADHVLTVDELNDAAAPVVATSATAHEATGERTDAEARFDPIHGRDREIRYDGERFFVEWGTLDDLEREVDRLRAATAEWIERVTTDRYHEASRRSLPQVGTLFSKAISFEGQRPIPRSRAEAARVDPWSPTRRHVEVIDDGGERSSRGLVPPRGLVVVDGLVHERIGRPTFHLSRDRAAPGPRVRPGDGSFRPSDTDKSREVPLSVFLDAGGRFDTDAPYLFADPRSFEWYRHDFTRSLHHSMGHALPDAVDPLHDALEEVGAATVPTVHLVASVARAEAAMGAAIAPSSAHPRVHEPDRVPRKWNRDADVYQTLSTALRPEYVRQSLAVDGVEGPARNEWSGTVTGLLPSFRGEAERSLSVAAGNPTSPDPVRATARAAMEDGGVVEVADWGNLLHEARRIGVSVPVAYAMAEAGDRFWITMTDEGAHTALVATTADGTVHLAPAPDREPPSDAVVERAFGAAPTPFPDRPPEARPGPEMRP